MIEVTSHTPAALVEKTLMAQIREAALELAVKYHIGTAPQRPSEGKTVVATAQAFEEFLMRPEDSTEA